MVIRPTALIGFLLFPLLAGCLSESHAKDDVSIQPHHNENIPEKEVSVLDVSWLARCEVAHVEANVTVHDQGQLEPSLIPVVDGRHCNVFKGTNGTLFVPLFPEGKKKLVSAVVRDGELDWLYLDTETEAVMLLLGGRGEPVMVKGDWPEILPGAQRTFELLWGVWAGETFHVFVRSYVEHPYPASAARQSEDLHLWWNGSALGQETLMASATGWTRTYGRLASNGNEVALAAADWLVTDLLGYTREEMSWIWKASTGAFDEPIQRNGVWIKDVTGGRNVLHACASHGGEVFHASDPDWLFQPVLTNRALSAECRVAASPAPHVLAYGLPAFGGSGDGDGGSGDGISVSIASWQNGSWRVRDLGRSVWSYVGLGSSGNGPFLADTNRDRSEWAEVLTLHEEGWMKQWGQVGQTAIAVDGMPNPTIYASKILDPDWNYGSWAALMLK